MRHLSSRPGRKKLHRNSLDMPFMVAPFLLWGMLVVVINVVTISQLNKVGGITCRGPSYPLSRRGEGATPPVPS